MVGSELSGIISCCQQMAGSHPTVMSLLVIGDPKACHVSQRLPNRCQTLDTYEIEISQLGRRVAT